MYCTKPIKALAFTVFIFINLMHGNAHAQQTADAKNKAEDAIQEKRMIDYLEQMRIRLNNPANMFASEAKVANLDSLLQITKDPTENLNLGFRLGQAYLEAGRSRMPLLCLAELPSM